MDDTLANRRIEKVLTTCKDIEMASAKHLLMLGSVNGTLPESHRPCETESRAQLSRRIFSELTGGDCLRCEVNVMHEWHQIRPGVPGFPRNERFLTIVPCDGVVVWEFPPRAPPRLVENRTEGYFDSAKEAVPEPFEPSVPCHQMSTRPCVDLSLDNRHHFRTTVCKPGMCVRFETKIADKPPSLTAFI